MRIEDLPVRKVFEIGNYEDVDDIYRRKKLSNSRALDHTAKTIVDNFRTTQNSIPKICYVIHEAKDGILAAQAMHRSLCLDAPSLPPLFNPEFDPAKAVSYIRKGRLKQEAKQADLWKVGSVPGSHFQLFCFIITTLISILSSSTIMKVLMATVIGGWCVIFLSAASFFTAVGILVNLLLKRRAQGFHELDTRLADMTDEEFFHFIDRFEGEDFLFSSYSPENRRSNIMICTLGTYNARKAHILLRYLFTLPCKQNWWVFLGSRNAREHFIFERTEDYSRRVFYLEPLSRKEKKRLAIEAGRKPGDPGIRPYDVDYICKKLLGQSEQPSSAELEDRISRFMEDTGCKDAIDIKAAIRLIAELSVNYFIDFSNKRYWQYLFRFEPDGSELTALDIAATKEVLFLHEDVKKEHQKQLNRLIPDIIREFSEDFKDIIASNPDYIKTSSYVQLCLIKALRCPDGIFEDRCLMIAEALLEEMPTSSVYFQTFRTPQWTSLIVEALRTFEEGQFYWFSPTLLNRLIRIWQGAPSSDRPARLFSLPAVLNTARTDLLLSINTDSDMVTSADNSETVDVISDHVYTAVSAAIELFGEDGLKGGRVPNSFGLLQVTQEQRQAYYYALKRLKEQSVIDFYEYLYDICCATISSLSGISFCCSELTENNLYQKYPPMQGAVDDLMSHYIGTILRTLLDQLKGLYPHSQETFDEADSLLRRISIADVSEEVLFLLAKTEVMGIAIVDFCICIALCMSTWTHKAEYHRRNDNGNITQDVYLGMGNYLIRLIFLIYHEIVQETLQNADFQYLIRILTDYAEPSGIVLGYLAQCESRVMPRLSREKVTKYLTLHQEPYLKNIRRVMTQLKLNELEAFITYLTEIGKSITSEDKQAIFIYLRNMVQGKFANSPKAPVLNELLTLLIDDCSSEVFLDRPAEDVLHQIASYSGDTVYLIYSRYIKKYRDKYLSGCPIVVEKMLESTIVGYCHPIVEYIIHSENVTLGEYVYTEKIFYANILRESNTKVFVKNLTDIKLYTFFLVWLIMRRQSHTELYQWVDEAECLELLGRLDEEKMAIMLLEAKEYLQERAWSRYGMLLFMKFLMGNSGELSYPVSQEYQNYTQEERYEYIKKNHSSIEPFVMQKNGIYYNAIYFGQSRTK